MVKSNLIVSLMVLSSILLILNPLVSCHVNSNDDSKWILADLRDLYDLFLRNENQQADQYNRFGHQMERKGGRSPSLRLRFGRRADPLWSNRPSMAEINSADVSKK
ncbi:short neuropeptide F-like [Panonychus citri]|uniref:short neuropeptide F-like n=1 Tax=Panonychus citri TaxID=50023 RepID=UPI0023081DA9|nr:short neuropeptide F-like [Panonychus citri]